MREVQEKALALGSSESFSCALDKCLLLPAQPKLSGVGEETSLSLQPFAPLAHNSLSCHLPGCLRRSGKSEGTCQALSAMHCAWDKGREKVVDIAGSSAEIQGAGLIQLPHSLQLCLPRQQRAQRARRGYPAPQAGGGISCLGHAYYMPAQVKLVVSSPLTTSPAAVLGSCLLHRCLRLTSSNEW